MKFLGSDDLKKTVRFAMDAEAQTRADRLTLTLLDVIQITGEGRITTDAVPEDQARRIKRPARKAAGEPAGHWDLVQGVYWITYNESVRIPDGFTLFLEPHRGLLVNGLWHPTLLIRDWGEVDGMLLNVGARGVRLVEGAPVTVGHMIG